MAIHQRGQRAAGVNPWAVLGVLMLGSFMSPLDLTIVNIAIPSILAGLHTSLDQILWVLNAYSLLCAVLLITAGRLGDIFGPRTIFAVGLFGVVFGLIEGQRYNWGAVWGAVTIPEIIGAGLLVLLLFLVTQARRQDREPLVPFAVFRDRNFTLMALVLAALGFAMLGLFLPLTIYYQSVLGLSALAAGLTIAPQPLAMMVVSPLAAGLSRRVNGKYLLIPGLALFAAGMAYIDWAAHAEASRWSFLPGLIASGIGLGFTWVPVFSLATRDLRPELAGVASGLLSTIQELGGVLGGAAIGALLQNRLAIALHAQAVHNAAQLPPGVRDPFVASFNAAAKAGFDVGRGQTGGSVPVPAGVPASVAQEIGRLAAAVFTHGYVDAMRPTLLLPIALVLLAAVSAVAVRQGAGAQAEQALAPARPEPQSVA